MTTASFAAIIVSAIGLLVFWSNLHRAVNRYFFSFSLHIASWLTCLHFALVRAEDTLWIRLASAIGTFVPLHMWLIKEACVGADRSWLRLRWLLQWLLPSLGLTALCVSSWYVVRLPNGHPHFGPGYYIYMVGVLTLYALLCRETVVQLKTQRGLGWLELQILLLGGCAAVFAIICLMALRAIAGVVWPIHVQPLVMLAFYCATVVAITTHRILDARQVVLLAGQKAVLVLAAAVIAFGLEQVLESLDLPAGGALFLTIAVTALLVPTVNRWLDRVFHFYPGAAAVREAIFAAAKGDSAEDMKKEFCTVLKGWGQSDRAVIFYYGPANIIGLEDGTVEDAIIQPMRQLRWATPERLARERSTIERERVKAFLANHSLGALVVGEGATVSVLVGVGATASRLPFTYPQVVQLLEIALVIQSAFERAHFSQKARHREQLATLGLLGASLAHEIRNPLVTIKTFVQLLPTHYQDATFREKFFRLIGDEVERIDRLTEQLLDLASPRTYAATDVELHSVLRATIDLVATKAAHKNVQLVTDLAAAPDRVYTDAAAAKQVMLNLCFNAIQALDGQEDRLRCIWVSTRTTDAGIEVAVRDSGPGIAPEMLPRLFQPFQTTKSSGFGLGLAICSDILANLNASITVDPPMSGQGATFRVTFPCQPSSS